MEPDQNDPPQAPTNIHKLAFCLLVAFLLFSGILFLLQGIALIR